MREKPSPAEIAALALKGYLWGTNTHPKGAEFMEQRHFATEE